MILFFKYQSGDTPVRVGTIQQNKSATSKLEKNKSAVW